jgi:hypothetical protein
VNRLVSRALLCGSAALTAAAVTDPIVEAASNAGFFGRGSFTDHSNLDVMPALALAAFAVLAWAVFLLRRGYGTDDRAPAAFLRAFMPAIFALQILVLFTMESAEQCAVYGHLLGGTIWMGAPVLAALGAHFAGALLFTAIVGRIASRSLRTIERELELALEFLQRMLQPPAASLSRLGETLALHASVPFLGVPSGRAPPSFQ